MASGRMLSDGVKRLLYLIASRTEQQRSWRWGHSLLARRGLSSSVQQSSYKLAIFDKDGTLTCFSTMWSPWCEATAASLDEISGKKLSDDFYDFLNYHKESGKFGISRLARDTNGDLKIQLADILTRKHGLDAVEAESLVEATWSDTFVVEGVNASQTVKALGDVKKIFSTLKENDIKIAVCSSDTRKSVTTALSDLRILEMVDRVMCGDDPDNVSKPAPNNIHTICSELAVTPEETVMIGDTHHDSVMGRRGNCGMIIGVLSGQGDPEELQDSDHLVHSIDDVLPIILGRRRSHQPAGYGSGPKTSPFDMSSKRHFSTSARRRNDYTHIIVGAGSAGCVLANRLTEDSSKSVLLVEAGPRDIAFNSLMLSWKIHMPAALTYNLRTDKYNWFYHTTPQKHADNRVLYWPRGRVWGGSSSLNAMVYIRGHAFDYDRWREEGAKGWNYDHCLPYFKKAQNHELGEDTYRGGSGPLNVCQGDISDPLNRGFLEAAKEAGYPFSPDLNGYQQEGFGPIDMTVHKGCRWSTATAYLRPALGRPNLTTKEKCLTTRLLFEGKKAVGIQCLHDKKEVEFRASDEIILCGGTINSPQLLLLSGIGNADELKKLDIPVVQHLPGVGKNLQDHIEVLVQHYCKKPITLYSSTRPLNMIGIGLQWFLNQSGKGATNHIHSGGFIRSRAGISHPDIQFHFSPSQYSDHGRRKPTCHAFQVHVGTLRDTSRGSITLKSKDPTEPPLIDPNYLATEDDVVGMRQCVKLSREILGCGALDELRGEELKPGLQVVSDSQIDAYVRATCETEYHPSSTCKMGSETDLEAVVDNKGRVMGIENLRVADASIMPSVVSGNLNAPTIMIAEKMADIISGKDPLHALDTPVYRPETLSTQR